CSGIVPGPSLAQASCCYLFFRSSRERMKNQLFCRRLVFAESRSKLSMRKNCTL
ncbi:unnamed protein product, partial [Amoebophrya sp. A25]